MITSLRKEANPKPMSSPIYNKFLALPLTERMGLLGLYSFLFFAWESKARAAVAFLFVLIPCLADRRFWGDLKKSPVVWVVALLFLYITLRAATAIIENPELRAYHLKDSWNLFLLGGFIFIGWLLKGKQSRIFLALTIALIGFWIGRLEHFPWLDAFAGAPWWKMRHEFGLPSAVGFGLYSASAALGLIILAPRIWTTFNKPLAKYLTRGTWLLLLLFSIQGVIVSRTRGVWLSLVILIAILLASNLHLLRPSNLAKSIVPLLLIALSSIALGYLNYSTFERRLSYERETTGSILTGDFAKIKALDDKGRPKSIGIRYHMFLFGLEHWQENPVFGSGPGITKPLMIEYWELGKKYKHLHNNYLEMLLRIGLIGTALILLMLSLLFYYGVQAYRGGKVDRDLFMILTAAIALSLLLSFSSFRMFHADWRYYWFLFGGAMFSFSLLPESSFTDLKAFKRPA